MSPGPGMNANNICPPLQSIRRLNQSIFPSRKLSRVPFGGRLAVVVDLSAAVVRPLFIAIIFNSGDTFFELGNALSQTSHHAWQPVAKEDENDDQDDHQVVAAGNE